VMATGFATKLVIVGTRFTVTMTVCVTAAPLDGVTVSVYMAVTVGLTVMAVPLVAARLPGVMTPVPLTKTPVSDALCPAVIVVGFAVKLEMEAAGGGGGGVEEPPQPVKSARPRLRAMTQVARTKSRFIIFPVAKKVPVFLAANDTALLTGLGRSISNTR
jgi:hypothetical protein